LLTLPGDRNQKLLSTTKSVALLAAIADLDQLEAAQEKQLVDEQSLDFVHHVGREPNFGGSETTVFTVLLIVVEPGHVDVALMIDFKPAVSSNEALSPWDRTGQARVHDFHVPVQVVCLEKLMGLGQHHSLIHDKGFNQKKFY
jgi:hypothetical protein